MECRRGIPPSLDGSAWYTHYRIIHLILGPSDSGEKNPRFVVSSMDVFAILSRGVGYVGRLTVSNSETVKVFNDYNPRSSSVGGTLTTVFT